VSPPPLRDGHDPLAPGLRRLGSREVKRMMEGKFVSIDKALRQHRSSRSEQPLGSIGNITLSTSTSKARTVTDSNSWFEAFLSSILPILLLRASQATSIDDIKARITDVERHVNYGLAALTYFERFTFTTAKNYLDTHRETCYAHNRDISEPDIAMHNRMTQLNSYSSSSSSTSTSSLSASAASNTATQANSARRNNSNNSNRGRSSKSATYTASECGKFNSYNGCHDAECPHKHACKHCKVVGHSQLKCDKWLALNPQRKK
jgi:hypothetical protein